MPEKIIPTIVVKCLRKQQSVQQIAARYGVSRSTWSKWENGQSRLPWKTFAQIPKVKERIEAALSALGYFGDPSDEQGVLQELLKFKRVERWSKLLKISPSALSNTQNGKRQLYLDLILDILRLSLSSSIFLRELFPDDFEVELAPLLQDELELLEALDSKPWAPTLYALLSLPQYADRSSGKVFNELQETLGVREEDLRAVMLKFHNTAQLSDASRRTQSRTQALEERAYWSKQLEALASVAQKRWPMTPSTPSLSWSLYMCEVSPRQLELLDRASSAFHQEVSSILGAPKGNEEPNEVVLLSSQCLPLSLFKAARSVS